MYTCTVPGVGDVTLTSIIEGSTPSAKKRYAPAGPATLNWLGAAWMRVRRWSSVSGAEPPPLVMELVTDAISTLGLSSTLIWPGR